MIDAGGHMFQLYDDERQTGYALTGLIKEIGRSEECDIALPDDSVSRVHARLDRNGEGWMLVDLGSTNGTFVNGQRVGEAPLEPGDRIEFGDVRLRFLPLQISETGRKRTTNVTMRRAADATRPVTESGGGLFSRVKTALRKKE